MNQIKRAEIALNEKLFNKNSLIEDKLNDIKNEVNNDALIYICKDENNTPIGVAIYEREKLGQHLNFYIHKGIKNHIKYQKEMFEYFSPVMDDVINAKLALENNLYIEGYLLKRILEDVFSGYNTTSVIEIVKDSAGKACGVVSYDHDSRPVNINIFVSDEVRGQKIGYQLIEQIKIFLPSQVSYDIGDKGSVYFWEKIKQKYKDEIKFTPAIKLNNVFKW